MFLQGGATFPEIQGEVSFMGKGQFLKFRGTWTPELRGSIPQGRYGFNSLIVSVLSRVYWTTQEVYVYTCVRELAL